MFARWSFACIIGLATPVLAAAQQEPLPPALERAEPIAEVPAPPPVYIPPPALPSECRPLGLWWVDTSVELAWMPNRPAPQTIRLRPPDFFGNRVPGLNIALDSRNTPSFQAGIGVHAGRWLDENQRNAFEFSALVFPGGTRTLNGAAPGTFVYFPNGPDQSAPLFLRFPEPLSGFTSAFPATASDWFATFDANYRAGLLITDRYRVDLLVGYRFAYLEDELYLGNAPADTHDEYRSNRMTVENTFHGGQIGLDADYRTNNWYTSGNVKLAYGALTTKSAGSGAFLFPDSPTQFRTDTRGAFLPSLNFRLGYRFSEGASMFIGYNFLYLSRVSRFGDAFTSSAGPLASSEFWIQSVSLGLDFRY